MDNPQYYQPLSHALHPPLVTANHSPQQQQYAAYAAPAHAAVSNGAGHTQREEEEEEEDDEEEVVEEELDRNEPDSSQHPATSSPRQSMQTASVAPGASSASTANAHEVVLQAHSQSGADGDESGKRKPGRPRGSRNRKPKAFTAAATPAPKPPPNTYHPGFYQYPPAPGSTVNPNQQFYEFQWRALNLCSEFYNAAEELVKAASPMVIAQCYQMGPGARVDPLAMIADAKRVCDNLLANPSQLVGQPVPSTYGYPSSYTAPYAPQPPPASNASPSNNTPASGSVITNPQSFVMPLGTSMPPPGHAAPNPYYSGVYAAARYPTAPYYSYHTQPPASYYPPPATAAPASAPTNSTTPVPASTPAVPVPTTSFNTTQPAASTSASSVGQQGSWSADEEDRLRKFAEQSREQGGPQNKGEIEWDWVVQQWGNSRTRHQILLKATALGLKESSTRTNKRKRETEGGATETNDRAPTPASHAAANATSAVSAATAAQSHTLHTQPTHMQQTQTQIAHTQPVHAQNTHGQPMHALTQPTQGQPTHSQPSHSQAVQSQAPHIQSAHSQPTHSQTTIAPSATTTTPVSTHASPALPPQRPPSSTTTQTTIAPARTTTNPSPATPSSMPWSMPIVAANTPSPVLGSAQIEQRTTSYYRPPATQRTAYGASAGASTTTPYAAASTSNTTTYGTAATSRPTSSHGSVAASHPYMYRPGINGTGRRDGANPTNRDPPVPFHMQPQWK